MKKILTSVAAIVAVVSASVVLMSGKYGDQPKSSCLRPAPGSYGGAPAGVCGDPFNSYMTCAQANCHNSYPVKQRAAKLTFNPPLQALGFVPNVTYTVSATFASQGCPNIGFEISPQSRTGAMMGTVSAFASSPNPDEVVTMTTNSYITHSQAPGGPNSATWTFLWKAPKNPGIRKADSVIFYQAYNAAPSSDGGGPTGDTIVLSTLAIAQDTIVGVGVADITNAELQANVYPTVSNGKFTVALGDESWNNATIIEIYNLSGGRVYQSQLLTPTSQMALNIPGGIYIVWLKNENSSTCKKIIISR